MQPQYIEYIVYILLLVISGGLEYFKLAPPQTAVAVLALVTGHFFGNSIQLGNQVTRLTSDVSQIRETVANGKSSSTQKEQGNTPQT